jgi:hypothetical protein
MTAKMAIEGEINESLNDKIEVVKEEHAAIEINKNDENNNDKKMELMLKENLSCEMFHFVLNFFYTPRLFMKLIFLMFVLLSYGLASYTIITLIIDYLNYDVITTTRTINETPVAFPKVSICNKNPLTTKFAYDFLMKSNLINMTQIDELLNGNRNDAIVELTLISTRLFGILQYISDDEKKKLAHNINDTLISCLFGYVKCDANDFQWEWDSIYGNCFSFNSGFNFSRQSVDLKKTFIAGNMYGLQVEFYVNYYENLTFFNSIKDDYGLVIRIDNVSRVIDYSFNGIFVSPGLHTYLALDRQFRTNLPYPFSDCENLSMGNFKSDLFDLITESKYDYTQIFCLQQCYQQLCLQRCNCCDSNFALIKNASLCVTNSQIKCAFDVYSETYLKNNYIQNSCLPRCPLECDSSRITYTSSLSQLSPKTYAKLLQKSPNIRSDFIGRSLEDESVVLQSVARLNIFYDSLSYTISTESPQTDMVSLIANIGGNLGLFMGVCLFSMGEMVVTLVELLFLKWQTKSKGL